MYRTPVNVFRVPDGFVIALTYGRESEWVKNVLAAGGAELETSGRRYRLSSPVLASDPSGHFPGLVRLLTRIAGVTDYLRASAAAV